MHYVIIGNSAAGIGAVEGIRENDKECEITIITSEEYHTYSRPLISYLLLGKTTEEKMRYRDADFYKDNNCKVLFGTTVNQINAEEQYVTLIDRKKIPYDKLVVATGSSAFAPQFEGIESVKDCYSFMCLEDAKELKKVLSKDKKVLIIGAGLIGLKCAEGINNLVSEVIVIDLAPRVLSSILDDTGAEMVKKHIESKGVNIILSHSVKKFDSQKAILDNDEIIDFDILVMAVGVRPNTSLLEGIAEIDRGIIIDEKSQTSCVNIYAAGDCTQTQDISSGQNKIMALLPNAYMQGEVAGINMSGGERIFDKAIPMNAIGFFGLHMITAGSYNGKVYINESEENYKCLFYSDNCLNGFIIIGDVDKAGIYTSLIRERTPLDSIDFELICERPGLMAFAKEERAKKLGERR